MKATIVLNSNINIDIQGDYLVGVDGGIHQILKQGKMPNLIIGDFDSYKDLPPNVETISLNVDKDLTDSEIAILELKKRGYTEIDIYGIEGGRLDHIYSNIMLIVFAGRQNIKAIGVLENGYVTYFNKGSKTINANQGDIVSIFPYAKTHVKSSNNLKFPLKELDLEIPSKVSGLSNVAIVANPSIQVSEGDGIIFVIKNSKSQNSK